MEIRATRAIASMAIAALLAAAPSAARGAEVGASASREDRGLDPRSGRDPIVNERMQDWGYGLLGSGLAVSIAGIALIEVDAYGDIGFAGFVTTGVGIGLTAVSAFLLGFSRPIHRLDLAATTVALATSKSGAVVSVGRTF